MAVKGFAPAKVNLFLHITGLRADGYHLLDSAAVFADAGDWITARAAPALSLTVAGPRAAGVPIDGRNLVLQAARLLATLRGVTAGAALHLDKHLPHGGGIGGGSSDAAATIRLLAHLWNVPPLTGPEALPLGADLPLCLAAPAPTRTQGVGEVLTPLPALPPMWLVLANPGAALPTAQIFKAHDALYPIRPPAVKAYPDGPFTPEGFQVWLSAHRNDLTKVAAGAEFAPVIPTLLSHLRRLPGCIACDMSGSGSTCWAWFSDEPTARAAARLITQTPWWPQDGWARAARVLTPLDRLHPQPVP